MRLLPLVLGVALAGCVQVIELPPGDPLQEPLPPQRGVASRSFHRCQRHGAPLLARADGDSIYALRYARLAGET
jgi:hypothetical protein